MALSSFVGHTASDWVNRQCKRYVPTAKAEPSQQGLRQRPGRLRAQVGFGHQITGSCPVVRVRCCRTPAELTLWAAV